MTKQRSGDDARWAIVAGRDASHEGEFVFGVSSTGVYCKPGCAARTPLRKNVTFFDTPDRAEAAGFRACKRCKPRAAGSDIDRAVDRAKTYLDGAGDRRVDLTELAHATGISAAHLQRSFKRIVGVSPREYQSMQRTARLRQRLRAGDTVSRATYEAGFGSSSRVYENAHRALGMTPAALRKGGTGARILYTIDDAPIGRVLIATTERGVCAVEIGSTDADVERVLRRDFPNAEVARDDDAHRTWVRAVLDRVRRPARNASNRIPLDLNGTQFQMRVWAALQQIPPGEQRSYREVAEAIGQPTATRAVARACATNRVAVVVPCHRVVREDGAPSGYKWGLTRKRRLHEEEAG